MGNIEKFDSIASRYDNDERREVAKAIAERVRALVGDAHTKTAIDFGCGTGLVGLELLDVFAALHFIDASTNMIAEVKRKLAEAGVQNADVLCYDLTMDSSLDLHADYIIVAQTLLHIKDTAFIVARLFDMLNPNGHLIVVDFDKNEAIVSTDVHNGFDQAALVDLAKMVGFSSVSSETFYHGANMFMKQDASLFILDAKK